MRTPAVAGMIGGVDADLSCLIIFLFSSHPSGVSVKARLDSFSFFFFRELACAAERVATEVRRPKKILLDLLCHALRERDFPPPFPLAARGTRRGARSRVFFPLLVFPVARRKT